MNCPPAIAALVLEIFQTAILRIRGLGWSDANASLCALEADHVHNLPGLLKQYSPELLKYYWDVERPSFISQSEAARHNVQGFEPLWESLRGLVEDHTEPALTK